MDQVYVYELQRDHREMVWDTPGLVEIALNRRGYGTRLIDSRLISTTVPLDNEAIKLLFGMGYFAEQVRTV